MKTKMYVITTVSNMHVGSGEYNVGVIDNLVQRDVVSGLPNINSSSLKGALREYFKGNEDEKYIRDVFGSSPSDDKMKQGSFRFFEAKLLSYPVRSDRSPYMRAVTPKIVEELLASIKNMDVNEDADLIDALNALSKVDVEDSSPIVFNAELDGAVVEDFGLTARWDDEWLTSEQLEYLTRLFGGRLVLLHYKDFFTLCDNNHLPVISRNYLESGVSRNLWYEEVVPRFAQFYFPVMVDEDFEETFDSVLVDGLVQIGGNSTIGYGYSKINVLSKIDLSDYEN